MSDREPGWADHPERDTDNIAVPATSPPAPRTAAGRLYDWLDQMDRMADGRAGIIQVSAALWKDQLRPLLQAAREAEAAAPVKLRQCNMADDGQCFVHTPGNWPLGWPHCEGWLVEAEAAAPAGLDESEQIRILESAMRDADFGGAVYANDVHSLAVRVVALHLPKWGAHIARLRERQP